MASGKQLERTNGGDTALPASRQAAIEQGLHMFQEVAADRDRLANEVTRLRGDISAYKVMVEALETQLADAQSRIQSATIMRDQAAADRCKWESLFIGIQAQLRAFEVPAAPLVIPRRDRDADAPEN